MQANNEPASTHVSAAYVSTVINSKETLYDALSRN